MVQCTNMEPQILGLPQYKKQQVIRMLLKFIRNKLLGTDPAMSQRQISNAHEMRPQQ
jgi:hypothetical protein